MRIVPRFVILEHDWPTRHWDLLLEAGSVLRAWRLLEEPDSGNAIPAEANSDHRLAYLTFEGELSGNRGRVFRWDAGTFAWRADGPDRVMVDLAGTRISGVFVLEGGLFRAS